MATHASTSIGATTPMRTANMSFLLDRLGQDCAPLQYLRELTQNAIQAIARLPKAEGEVVWDVDWNIHTLSGRYKLSLTVPGEWLIAEHTLTSIPPPSTPHHVHS